MKMAQPKIKSNGLYFNTDAEAIRVLTAEGKKLERIAKQVWRSYLGSYSPKQYVRTGRSLQAIKLKGIKVLGKGLYSIELTWENSLAYHDSYIYKQGYTSKNVKGHSIMLIGTRWHSAKLERVYRKPIYRHTYWSWNGGGGSYLNAVVQQYKAVKDRRINLEVQWSGAFIK
ncbi:neck protein [Bacillus phage vB_BanS-Thrax5]|nr:neck protein [Bacillus phage vB_BanS-Thrax5]